MTFRCLMPTADAAQHLGIPASTIRRWASEDRVCRYGTDSYALYDVAELEELARLLDHKAS